MTEQKLIQNTVEQRIYEASPTAPTPEELAQGLFLLVCTFWKNISEDPDSTEMRFELYPDKQVDGTYNKIINFRLDYYLDPFSPICFGFDVYARNMFPIQKGQSPYGLLQQVIFSKGKDGKFVTQDAMRFNSLLTAK